MKISSASKILWASFFVAMAAFSFRFIEPSSIFTFKILSLVYLISSISCIYFGSVYFGWAATKKQKSSIGLFLLAIFSVVIIFDYINITIFPEPIRIIVFPAMFSPLLSIIILPILLGLSHKSMASKNNWLLYPLFLGPTFDFMAKAASI